MAKNVYTDYTFVGGATVKGLPTPSAGTDGANKAYVDNLAAGWSWKDNVRVATTGNGTLATAYENADTVDGVALVTGDRILLKDQTTGAENGIYTVNASGAPTRATDADSGTEIVGAVVQVDEGTANGNTIWMLTTNAPITLGSTALVFTQFNGTAYTAGNGIGISGSVISADPDTGILVTGTGISIDTSIVVRKFAATFGDNSATSFNIDHNLGTVDVTVAVFQNSDGVEIECGVTRSTTNRVVLDFTSAPTASQFRAVVHA